MKFDHRFVLTDSTSSMRAYHADGVTMRLDFFNNILRVALLRDASALLPTWSVCPGEEDCPLEGRDKLSAEGFEKQTPDVEETEESLRFSLGGADFTVEKKNFRIIARREKGILYADRSGLAYNFDGELGDGSIHYTRREAGERIFGLGDKSGAVIRWAFPQRQATRSTSSFPFISARTVRDLTAFSMTPARTGVWISAKSMTIISSHFPPSASRRRTWSFT